MSYGKLWRNYGNGFLIGFWAAFELIWGFYYSGYLWRIDYATIGDFNRYVGSR